MKNARRYIDEDFLLSTETAKNLYHGYAEGLPIIDYHCHLPPAEIAEDKRWDNIAQVWLGGDHYKWRTMRSNGIDEKYCTGDATDREKFNKFAETMPYLLRNPMHHWSHLELSRYFGVSDKVLSPATADEIWARTSAKLNEPEMSARGLMRKSNVKLVCTTDDPTDSLKFHKTIAADKSFDIKVLPTWRPDKAMKIDETEDWNKWIDTLAKAADVNITDISSFWTALKKRHDFFASAGCKLSDYGLRNVPAVPFTERRVASVFACARAGKTPSFEDAEKFRSAFLESCGRMDAESDWTWQLHFNALRDNNIRLLPSLGHDTGFDSIGDWSVAQSLSRLLGRLDSEDKLPRTILYTLNPKDNELLAAMCGNFQRGPIPGKIQLGGGWWFNDQLDGMRRQIEALSQLGLISRFVGMLTDSRSFLSYTRHEYFRRLVCSIFGEDIERGLIPDDIEWTGKIIKGISYNNAASYFGFGLPQA